MKGLVLEMPLVVGEVVEVTNGVLSGIRGVLIQIAHDGRAIIRLDEQQSVLLVVPAKIVAVAPQ